MSKRPHDRHTGLHSYASGSQKRKSAITKEKALQDSIKKTRKLDEFFPSTSSNYYINYPII